MPQATERYHKPASDQQELRWARIWFGKLSQFHQRQAFEDWQFTPDDVIKYLRSRRDLGVPAWKRMKVIEGLIYFRNRVQKRSADDLIPLKNTMAEVIQT